MAEAEWKLNSRATRALQVHRTIQVFEFVKGDERLGLVETEARLNAYQAALRTIAEGNADNPQEYAKRFLEGQG